MLMRDRNIEWKRKRLFFDPLVGSGWTTAGTVPVGLHTGAPVYEELSTFGFGAVMFELAADEWVQKIPLPIDVDVTYPIRFRIHWSTQSVTAADTATFILTYAALNEAEALIAAATALNTAIAVDTHTGGLAYGLHKTAWGIINADVLSDGDVLVLETEIDATDITIATEFVYFLGLEMEYTPKKTAGGGCCQEATANAE